MKLTLLESIKNINVNFKKNKWSSIFPSLHESEQVLPTQLITKKIKNRNSFVYKTEIKNEIIIYEYFFEKVKDIESSCLITRICFKSGEMWEKVVYINNQEINIEQKIIEQYRVYANEDEFVQEDQIIKDENDSKVFIRKKSILQFKNRENINNVIDNNVIKVKESKFSSCLKKWIVRPLIFVSETYLFGLVSGLLSVLAGKMALWTAFQWWNPIAIGISAIVGTTVPMGVCIALAILVVVAIPIVKDYVIKPIIKKIKKSNRIKKNKKTGNRWFRSNKCA